MLLLCRSRSTTVNVKAVVEAPMSYEPNLRSRTTTVLGESYHSLSLQPVIA